jgi:hypothetical protein
LISNKDLGEVAKVEHEDAIKRIPITPRVSTFIALVRIGLIATRLVNENSLWGGVVG